MNMFKKNGGFTLVELIVVIAILAILAAVAIPAYSGYITKANDAADTTALGAVKTACMGALATNGTVEKVTVTTATVNEKIVIATIIASTIESVENDGTINYKNFPMYNKDDATQNNPEFAIYLDTIPTLKGSFKAGATWTTAGGWVANQ
jgi:type IV pilus assembly protein PilA